MTKTKEIASLLSKYSPCDVSDALVHLGVKSGGFIPNLVMRSPVPATVPTSAGPAYTVLYAPKSDPRPAVKESYIDQIPQGAMLVMALTLPCQRASAPYVTVKNALYGGLMSGRAKYRGAAGSVILGRIRDLDEHNDLQYPVWSYGVGTTAPGPVVKVVGINVPLQVKIGQEDDQIVTISPGDYVVADKNGVVTFADDEKVNEIIEYIPKRVDADTHVAEDIRNGKPAAEAQLYWRSKI